MRWPSASLPVLLVLLLVLASASLSEAQASSGKLAPFTCFFNECAVPKSSQDIFQAMVRCLKSAFPASTTKVVLPDSPAFGEAKAMATTRFQRTPAAVVYAHNTPDVQAAVKCAYNNGVRVSVAGGRHSYEGWTIVDNYLVVDMSNMTEARVTGRQGNVLTVQVGPGNTNALLISQLQKAGYPTAGTIIGQCPSVGVSGYILGGGQGDLSRMFGLACDQLLGLEMVDFKGNVVTANSTHNSDLMWASCGGGTGLGVVTRWTLKAHDLGKEPFSRITLHYRVTNSAGSIDKVALVASMLKLQDFIMSDKTDLRFSGGGFSLGGGNLYFAGPLSTAMRLLKEGGLLNPDWLDKATPSRAVQDKGHLQQAPAPMAASQLPNMPPYGVLASQYENYYETIMMAECMWVAGPDNAIYGPPAARVGFGPSKSCTDPGVMARFKAMAAQPGSPINDGSGYIWRHYNFYSACRNLPPLNVTAWEALGAVILDPRCDAFRSRAASLTREQMTQHLKSNPDAYFCIALKMFTGKPTWNHLLGGAVAKVPQAATAYPWRKAISPLCFDSGMPDAMFEADGHTFKPSYTMDLSGMGLSNLKAVSVSPAAVAKAIQDVQGAYLKAIESAVGKDTARQAYLNYQTTQVEDYAEAYWGPNYKRLQQIKAKWDPEGFFSKPFTVQPAKA